MKVLKVVEALDVGKAINPDLVKGQIIGGIVQGLQQCFTKICVLITMVNY